MFRRIVYFHLMRHHSKIVLVRTPLPTLYISLTRRRTVRWVVAPADSSSMCQSGRVFPIRRGEVARRFQF